MHHPSIHRILANTRKRAGSLLHSLAAPFRIPVETRAATSLQEHPSLIVLAYHEITPDLNHPLQYIGTGVRPEQLHAHLSWCAARFPFVRLHEGITKLRQKRLQSTSVALTFDDGHRGIADHAYAVLVELSVPATLFINAPFLDDQDYNWLLKVIYLMSKGYERELRDLFRCADSNLIHALRSMKNRSPLDSMHRLTEQFNRLSSGDKPSFYLSRNFLKKEAGRLLDLGNHSADHYRFCWLSYDEQVSQIRRNHEALQEFSNLKPLFAVPFGGRSDWNAETLRACASLGLEFVTLHGGVNPLVNTGVEIRRMGADRQSEKDFPNLFYRNALLT